MNVVAPFVARPIATSLVTIGVLLAGIIAFFFLPVAPLPDIDFPVIVVSASMAGASPETMATSVATPLERHLGAIADVDEMTSENITGSTTVVLVFNSNRNIDGAARDVQAAINAARADLPTSLNANPSYFKINPGIFPIMILALTSETLSPGQIYDSASTILQQKLSQISGIGRVRLGGSSLPAVRVDLNPLALFKYGVGLEDVRTALSLTNANAPKGSIDQGRTSFQVYTNDQATRAEQYAPLIVAYRNGSPVRLSDVANVYEGVQDIRNIGMINGKPAVIAVLSKQPGANVVATADRVKALIPQIQASLPPAIHLMVVNDLSNSIRKSLGDMERSLILSVVLVIGVVYLFLRDGRATIIPSVAVPVSLIGTFGIMYLLGFSLNNLSLTALTIATGFVIDDAIVVLENVTRHIEDGMPRAQAVLQGAGEVAFTVLSMSMSLIAVFMPLLLMGTTLGKYFQQFAVTLSVSIVVSLVVSLTTTPMLCRFLTEHREPQKQGLVLRLSERAFNATHGLYERMLIWALRYPGTILTVLIITIGLNIYLFTVVPGEFFPNEDNGNLMGAIVADQSISFQAMKKKFEQFVSLIHQDPDVENVVGFTGGGGGGPNGGSTNQGQVFVELKPASERKESTDQVRERLAAKLANVAGAQIYLQGAQFFSVGGRSGNAANQYTLEADTLDELNAWEPRILAALEKDPELQDVSSDEQSHGLEVDLKLDRATASRLGITVAQIDNTLYDAFGQRQVSRILKDNNQYTVVMEVAPEFWQSPETLRDIYISTTGAPVGGTEATNAVIGTTILSSTSTPTAAAIAASSERNAQLNSIASSSRVGSSAPAVSTSLETMVPLSAIARYGFGTTPVSVNHEGPFIAATFSYNTPPGEPLGTALNAITRTMDAIHVPISIHSASSGNAKELIEFVGDEIVLLLAAFATVYIVLGVLYESYIHPVTILSTLPPAGVGALFALLLTHTPLSVPSMIGVVLLIGIVKKNAIMMIDFALDAERSLGLTSQESIYQACLKRFRPIMMTTFAAILGALPLALGFGTAFSRSLGISVVGGLVVSQLLTLFTTPVVYLYMDRFRLWCRRIWQRWYLGLWGDPEVGAGGTGTKPV